MQKKYLSVAVAGFALLVLILDTKTALSGAAEGIRLCIQTVIPSLFPFLVLSIWLTTNLLGQTIPPIRWLCRLLKIPDGAESLVIIGFLGGYPVGAQCVSEAVHNGTISRESGQRMLAFCSNAGPAFLFGIGSIIFPDRWMCWAIWLIHIASAIIVGILTPGILNETAAFNTKQKVTFSQSMHRAIRTMASICGWVVLFRIGITFCQQWFLWYFPAEIQCLLTGILEMTNGCCNLAIIPHIPSRFMICTLLINLGGICVLMQTYSVTIGLNANYYLPGKICQCTISFLLSLAILYPASRLPALVILSAGITCIYFLQKTPEKRMAFFRRLLYNKRNSLRR